MEGHALVYPAIDDGPRARAVTSCMKHLQWAIPKREELVEARYKDWQDAQYPGLTRDYW
jgi:hypothetical protein